MSGSNPKHRRAARIAAVQALYQMELSSAATNVVIHEFVNHRFGADGDKPAVDIGFFEDIVKGTVQFQADIDAAVDAKLADGWPLRRLDMTLRATLRVSIYEIMRRPDVPALVVISEYVDIANDFFDGKEPGIVNGVVENIAKDIRAAEFGLIGAATAPQTSS